MCLPDDKESISVIITIHNHFWQSPWHRSYSMQYILYIEVIYKEINVMNGLLPLHKYNPSKLFVIDCLLWFAHL